MKEGLTAADLFAAAGLSPGNGAAAVEAPARTPDVRLVGDKIVIGPLPYDPERVAAVRGIPGRKWVGSKKVDEVPLDGLAVAKVLALAEQFDLLVEDALIEASATLVAETEAALAASRATDAEVDVDLAGEFSLYPFQRAAVAYGLQARRTFIGMDMGLGKSPSSLAIVEHEAGFPAIVVVPAVMKYVWPDEVEKFFPGRTVTVVEGLEPGPIPPADYTIVNWDILAARLNDLLAIGAQSLIADESQYSKNEGSPRNPVKRTKAAKALAASIPADGIVLLLTGTFITNRPIELLPQLEMMGRLDAFGGRQAFRSRYCWDEASQSYTGARHLGELNDRLRVLCYYRVNKSDVLPELPPVQHSVQHIETAPGVMAEYAAVESGVLDVVGEAGGSWSALGSDGQADVLRRITALRVLAARAKIDSAGAWVENWLDANPGKKILVFGHHREIVDALAERMGAPRIQGGQSKTARAEASRSFQDDPNVRVLVCAVQAAGVGLTLTAASDVVFTEGAWTPAAIDQAIGRAYGRMNDLHGVNAWYLYGRGATIDDDMGAMVAAKRVVVDAVTDGVDADADETSSVGALIERMLFRRFVTILCSAILGKG